MNNADLKAWAGTKPANEVIGLGGSKLYCPIARYYKEVVGEQVVVTKYRSTRYDGTILQVHTLKIQELIARVDSSVLATDNHEVTSAQFLKILEDLAC